MKLENKILIGTNNPNKLKQFKAAFERYAPEIELLAPMDLGIMDDVEEDGDDLLTNAKKKAQFFGEKANLICLSDDTGIFVDVLNGEPGLHSKRWHDGTDRERCLKLIDRLKNFKPEEKTARYIGVVVVYDPRKKEFWDFERRVEGWVADQFKGIYGFGYDGIFKTSQFEKHYAQLTDEQKDQISHRSRGVKSFVEYLKKLS